MRGKGRGATITALREQGLRQERRTLVFVERSAGGPLTMGRYVQAGNRQQASCNCRSSTVHRHLVVQCRETTSLRGCTNQESGLGHRISRRLVDPSRRWIPKTRRPASLPLEHTTHRTWKFHSSGFSLLPGSPPLLFFFVAFHCLRLSIVWRS